MIRGDDDRELESGHEPRSIPPPPPAGKSGPRWLFIALILLAAALRLALLDLKPAHFDEGVNGWFVDTITRQGYYHYDPGNYHGPLHMYVLFLAQTLLGRHIWALRLPVALLSIGTVWLVLAFRRFMDWRICAWAAAAMAVSPAMVFYGRYAIHESELVFFLLLTVFGFAEMWTRGTRAGLWAAAMGLTGAVLTKETYIIHFACFLLAGICWLLWGSFVPAGRSGAAPQLWKKKEFLYAAGASLALIVFFYSGTFMDWRGLSGLWETFAAWAKTGTEDEGHAKPLWHWAYLFARYEWPALLGLVAAVFALRPRENGLIRYLAIYGGGAFVAYSLVPYKTPWCIISILWPFYFLFGALLAFFSRLAKWPVLIVGTGLICASLVWSLRLNFQRYTDESEPYVYVQTFEDLYQLTGPLDALTATEPDSLPIDGHIILSSYHPLPWVLGDLPNVGYYADSIPARADSDFLLVDESRVGEVEGKLHDAYFTEPFRLRASQERSRLYFNADKFRNIFPDREPEFLPR